MTKPDIVNFYGGPGAGKSRAAYKLTALFKENGISTEFIGEYAKDMTWQSSFKVLSNQMYVFGKQQHKIWRVADQVDAVVTDGALLNSLIYGTTSYIFKALVLEEYNKFNNINIYIRRAHPYEQAGRAQNEEEAKMVDLLAYKTIQETITKFDFEFDSGSAEENAVFAKLVEKFKK